MERSHRSEEGNGELQVLERVKKAVLVTVACAGVWAAAPGVPAAAALTPEPGSITVGDVVTGGGKGGGRPECPEDSHWMGQLCVKVTSGGG
jgi:hypothetical protein